MICSDRHSTFIRSAAILTDHWIDLQFHCERAVLPERNRQTFGIARCIGRYPVPGIGALLHIDTATGSRLCTGSRDLAEGEVETNLGIESLPSHCDDLTRIDPHFTDL